MRELAAVVLGCAAVWGCAEGQVSQTGGTTGMGGAASGTSGVGSSGGAATVGSTTNGATVGSTTNGTTVGSTTSGATVGSTGNGTTVGSTTGVGSTGSGGAGSTGNTGAGGSLGAGGGDPYNTPVMCSSNMSWVSGNDANMRPGEGCDTCHVLFGQASGHTFDISGTVYPTAHEPNDCDGANVSGAQVIITDKNGMQTTLAVNSVGNFYHDNGFGFLNIATPYTAKVAYNGKTLRMIASQTVGDCNSCHTESGAMSAPGRIILPP